jgi:hypothetical protein
MPILNTVVARGTGVLGAIFSTNFRISRLSPREKSVLNGPLFDVSFVKLLVGFPPRDCPVPGHFCSIATPCEPDARDWLCCRVDWAMHPFFKGNMNWFLRAIDDG